MKNILKSLICQISKELIFQSYIFEFSRQKIFQWDILCLDLSKTQCLKINHKVSLARSKASWVNFFRVSFLNFRAKNQKCLSKTFLMLRFREKHSVWKISEKVSFSILGKQRKRHLPTEKVSFNIASENAKIQMRHFE